MNFAEKLANVLKSAKQEAGLAWSHKVWLQVVNDFADSERPLGKDGKVKKTKRAIPINKMSDDEFLDFLKSEPSLAGIDVDREIGLCRFHFKAKGVDPSRMRIVNWLGRADKKLARHGRDSGTRSADLADRSLPPPHGWQEFMKRKQREWVEKNGSQYDPPGSGALHADNFFGMPAEWRAECRAELGGEGEETQ